MLINLNIKNYALIEDIEIDLGNGLTTITGETGAGKSIILGAIGLLAGKRADRSMLKNDSKKCIIEASFKIGHLNLKPLFDQFDLDYEDVAIIRREFSKEGKSRIFINDSPAVLQHLKEVMNRMLDVHSQHENLELNKKQYQLNSIDLMADNNSAIKEYTAAYRLFMDAGVKLEELKISATKLRENTDLIVFQLNELNDADLTEGEQENLESESDKLNHAEEIKSNFHTVEGLFIENETNPISILNQINSLLDQTKSHFSEIGELSERTKNLIIELEDIRSELEKHSERFSYDPERLQIVQDRLSSIYRLQQKFRLNTVTELLEKKELLRNELFGIEGIDDRLEEVEKMFFKRKVKAEQLAGKLSKRRISVLTEMEDSVTHRLQLLGMMNSKFKIDLQRKDMAGDGIDSAEFLFSANKGVEAQPIGKVASGGELSRLMLSIKALLTGKTELPTIIFDEIDAGISGEIAEKMGRIIRDMCNTTQVIAITHLPQIAAMGDQHIVVFKDEEGETSKTKIRKIEGEERTAEVARLLSGEEISKEALDNAKVLLSTSL